MKEPSVPANRPWREQAVKRMASRGRNLEEGEEGFIDTTC
jgi:hypothetical protein